MIWSKSCRGIYVAYIYSTESITNVPGNVSGGHAEPRRRSKKSYGGTEGWRKLICRAVIRNIGRREINEWTMTQWGRQLFGGRNTLKGGEMGRRRVGKERTTDRDRERLGENENKKREREGWMEGRRGRWDERKNAIGRTHKSQCQLVFHIQCPTLNSDAQQTPHTHANIQMAKCQMHENDIGAKRKNKPTHPTISVTVWSQVSVFVLHLLPGHACKLFPANEGDLLAVVRELPGTEGPSTARWTNWLTGWQEVTGCTLLFDWL